MARVLVVEDERVIAWHLQTVLEKLGHTVVESTDSGFRAIQAAEAAKPDVVIMDICLKGSIDGVEAADQIYRSFNIPVIYLTAFADSDTLQRAKRSSPYGYLLKPLRAQDLQSTIEITLHRHQLERSALSTQQQIQASLNEQLQQVSAQFSVGIVCIHLLQELFRQLEIRADEAQALQTLMWSLGRSLNAHYCWLTQYDREQTLFEPFQGRATILCEYRQDEMGAQTPLVGSSFDIEAYPNFYQLLSRREPWLSPIASILPIPYQSLELGGFQLLICPLGDEQTIVSEMGIVVSAQAHWSTQQVELISTVMGQAVIALRQREPNQPVQDRHEPANLDRLKEDFISSVSHELRTPLTNMRMAVEMVQRVATSLRNTGTTPEAQQSSQLLWQRMERYLQVLQEEWNQEFNLINDLLDFQASEASTDAIQLVSLNLQQWLPAIVNRFLSQALKQRQRLVCRVAPDLPLFTTHSLSLERILSELLNNALKYTPSGQQIVVAAQFEAAQVKLSVTNTGVTIPLEELGQIFQPLYRIPRPDSWNYSGTGLGLALVKKLVGRLEGTIQVESENASTTFTVSLPATRQMENQ